MIAIFFLISSLAEMFLPVRILKVDFFFVMHMGDLPVCISAHHICGRPEGFRSPGTGAAEGCNSRVGVGN